MKRLFIVALIALSLIACKKTVRITDTSTNTSIIIDDQGIIVEGEFKLNKETTISVKEDSPEE